MEAFYLRYQMNFIRPVGTSRGQMAYKETWFLTLNDGAQTGIGECGMFRGLSIDDRPDYEEKLQWVCDHIHWGEAALYEALHDFPSIQFGLEMAFRSLRSTHPALLFPSEFTEGKAAIPINGLVWMGDTSFMHRQLLDKIQAEYRCVKMKIGALDFQQELGLLSFLRSQFNAEKLEIRVDANGAFAPEEALSKLKQLAVYELHSIEQPIAPKQWEVMRTLCQDSPIPIALDEELIGVSGRAAKKELLETLRPQYIILKPTLVGGFRGSLEWIELAESMGIGWWITSALESNVGLNAIAQWTYTLQSSRPQGLGTGALYANNFDCPLEVVGDQLCYRPEKYWGLYDILPETN